MVQMLEGWARAMPVALLELLWSEAETWSAPCWNMWNWLLLVVEESSVSDESLLLVDRVARMASMTSLMSSFFSDSLVFLLFLGGFFLGILGID